MVLYVTLVFYMYCTASLQ